VPILPPASIDPPPFTLGRLRLTTQRLYLAAQPAYIPFFARLVKLATWEDRGLSLKYCAIFWILWYYNLLLPALLLRIFYSLVRRRIFPYPTLAELREHRAEIIRANEFGDEVHSRLSASSISDIKEIWRLLRVANKAKVKAKKFVGGNRKKDESLEESVDSVTVLDDAKESEDERDIKQTALHLVNEVANLHERVKNIFIWRRPAVSKSYSVVYLRATSWVS
jgi:hypothetical protein